MPNPWRNNSFKVWLVFFGDYSYRQSAARLGQQTLQVMAVSYSSLKVPLIWIVHAASLSIKCAVAFAVLVADKGDGPSVEQKSRLAKHTEQFKSVLA